MYRTTSLRYRVWPIWIFHCKFPSVISMCHLFFMVDLSCQVSICDVISLCHFMVELSWQWSTFDVIIAHLLFGRTLFAIHNQQCRYVTLVSRVDLCLPYAQSPSATSLTCYSMAYVLLVDKSSRYSQSTCSLRHKYLTCVIKNSNRNTSYTPVK